ncbi:glutathione peroxidase [Rossellomorea marisflavi]|jgi:glutathione peroxidase|uniref:Glutathione peroxidase n=1 Tax=Rossellomorea marisflavi TaxID=189381 RepID=A0A5D4R636_9BACI|nr:glutathione peroxidase [Rossellomorea marisflavi]MBV6686294.1 glutathione peroxidase [Bacillus sp. JRC01]VXB27768.1 bacillithiol peroxidase [Bacillus sp. 349Y]MCM2591927.1 glutathione peroxidase [Rossellomorea marisflavi]TYS46060.1 glutathione peroxidase [Rossellomorea marisflavi]UTE72962.1 glutathione peroxidase [Rossellomorea marisflavi]
MISSLYDLTVKKSDGSDVALEDYEGKVMLIVNTASKCGFTPQFKELQGLYEEYKEQGLVVLGFPCDQFMNQEFDDQDEILEFCQVNYGVSFPMFAKVDVKGKDAHPLFKYLTKEKKGLLLSDIKWNFTKFLISKDGEVYDRYSPQTNPRKIEDDIVKLLQQ